MVAHVPSYTGKNLGFQQIKMQAEDMKGITDHKFEQWKIKTYFQDKGVVLPKNYEINEAQFKALKTMMPALKAKKLIPQEYLDEVLAVYFREHPEALMDDEEG